MSKMYQNIYKAARRTTNLTQEAVAEWIGVSVESIRAYEGARRIPPSDVVERMVLRYHTPYLAYEHLRETTDLMAYIVPELEQRGVLESAVRICLSLKRSASTAERLLELAQDGEIASAQREEFEQLVEVLQELVRPCLELEVYWRNEKKRPVGCGEHPAEQ